MYKDYFHLYFIHGFNKWYCQNEDSIKETTLPSVIIKAFEQTRKLKDVAAAVNYIGKKMLESFDPSSIVSAVNTLAGVRMEEH